MQYFVRSTPRPGLVEWPAVRSIGEPLERPSIASESNRCGRTTRVRFNSHFGLTGDVLADYLGPLPSESGGWHRFVFLVYRQPGRIEPATLPRAGPCDWAARARFSAKRFAQLHRLERPRAINYFVTRFDSSVPGAIERCLARRKARRS